MTYSGSGKTTYFIIRTIHLINYYEDTKSISCITEILVVSIQGAIHKPCRTFYGHFCLPQPFYFYIRADAVICVFLANIDMTIPNKGTGANYNYHFSKL